MFSKSGHDSSIYFTVSGRLCKFHILVGRRLTTSKTVHFTYRQPNYVMHCKKTTTKQDYKHIDSAHLCARSKIFN